MKKTKKKGGGPGKKSSKPNSKGAAPLHTSGITHVRNKQIILDPNGNPLTKTQLNNYNRLHSAAAERGISNSENNGPPANESTAKSRRAVLEIEAALREIKADQLATMGERVRREAKEAFARQQANAIARQEIQRVAAEAEAEALNKCPPGQKVKNGICVVQGGGKKPRLTRRRKRR